MCCSSLRSNSKTFGEWQQLLQLGLALVVLRREQRVRAWVAVNTERFAEDNGVRNFIERELGVRLKDFKARVAFCGYKCEKVGACARVLADAAVLPRGCFGTARLPAASLHSVLLLTHSLCLAVQLCVPAAAQPRRFARLSGETWRLLACGQLCTL